MSRSESLLLAHWDQTIRPTAVTPLQFYEAIVGLVEERGIPHQSISYVTLPECGLLSARRIYLRIRFRQLIFDIAGMRVADDALSVFWWLSKTPPGLFDLFCEIPVLGFVLRRFVQPTTFYSFDSTIAFQRLVHDCVVDVIEQVSSARALHRNASSSQQPLLKEFYN